MKLLIATECVPEALLIGALLHTGPTSLVEDVLIHGSLEAPFSMDTDAVARIKTFKPNAYLFFCTGRPEMSCADVQTFRAGWQERVGRMPMIVVIENKDLWTPGNISLRSWLKYLHLRPNMGTAEVRDAFRQILMECAGIVARLPSR